MPGLIIKPEATSGNKLILKDQAGGAVLTTADSGVTAGDTILATKTGTETLTNKTLTAPTVADMSNCTFPAGMVIQTVFNEYTTGVEITSTTDGSPTSTGLTCAITPKVAGSKILGMIDIHLMIRANSTVADAGVACKVTDGSSYIFTQGGDAHMGLYLYGGSGDPSDEWRGLQSIKYFVNATNTSARTYTVHAYKYPSSNAPIIWAQVNSSKSMFTLMEIAQ